MKRKIDYMSKQGCEHKRVRDRALWIGKMLGNLGKYMLGLLKSTLKTELSIRGKKKHTQK